MALAIALSCGCNSRPPATEDVTVWQSRGKWSGHGAQQTDPFISSTGLLRLTWEAKGAGPFKIVVNSDVSGRPLLVAVERTAPAHDVTYVTEDPRSFFLVMEGADIDWTVEVAEGLPATRSR